MRNLLLSLRSLNPQTWKQHQVLWCRIRLDVNKRAATNKSSDMFKPNKGSCSSRSFSLLSTTSICVKKHFHSFNRNNSWFPAYQKEATKTEQVSALPSISKSAAELTRWRSARLISRQQKLQITARKQHVGVDLLMQRATTFSPPKKHSNPSTILILVVFLLEEVFLPAAQSLGLLSLQLPVWGLFKLISLRLPWGSI